MASEATLQGMLEERERYAAVHSKEAKLREREAMVQQREEMLLKRDTFSLATLDETVKGKEAHLRQVEEALKESERELQESVKAVCDWALSELQLHRVEAGILASNLRSRKVLEACGFLEEGHAKEYLEIAGVRRDHVLFALTRP